MRAALFLAVCEGMSLVAQAARSESRIDPQRWPTTISPSICAQQEAGGAFALTTAPFLLLRDDQPRETALAGPAAPHRQPTCPRPGLGQADHLLLPARGTAPVAFDGADLGASPVCDEHATASPPTPTPTPMTAPALWSAPTSALAPASPAGAALDSTSASPLRGRSSLVAGRLVRLASAPPTPTPTPMTMTTPYYSNT